MSTGAASSAGRPANVVDTVRGAASTLNAVRAFVILSFILYEVPFLRRLAAEDRWLALPLVDVGLSDGPATFFVLEAVYLCASVVACFPRFVVPGCLVAAGASILLVVLDLSYRLQFAFLPGGALIALAVSGLVARNKDPKLRVDLPLVLFLGSVYAFATLHKYLNFDWMKASMPADVFRAPGGLLPAVFGSADNPILDLVVWTVVPYEALLAVVTISRRLLNVRLACVLLFHWMLIVLVPFIWHVSLYMLCLHLYLAMLQAPSARERLLAGRNWYAFLGIEGLFVGAKLAAPSIGGPAGTIVDAVAFGNLAAYPLFFLYQPFWKSERGAAPGFDLATLSRPAVAAFACLLIAFGFSPLMLAQTYSVRSLGWSMFAGGEYREGLYYTLRVPAAPCFAHPVVPGMIWAEPGPNQLTYMAFRRSDLERLEEALEARKCGGPLQVELARFGGVRR